MKSIWQKLCISGNYFSPRRNVGFFFVFLRHWWGVEMSSVGRVLQSEVREICSLCLSLSQTQCILCDWQGWLLIICLSWLPSEEKMQRCSLTLEGHWSQEQLISTGERLRSPISLSLLVSPTAHGWRQTEMRSPLCFLLRKVEVLAGEMERSFKRHM